MSLDPIKLFEFALGIDRSKAAFLFFGFLLIALSVIIANTAGDTGIPFWAIPVALLLFSLVAFGLTQLPRLLRALLSWVLVLLFLLWLAAVLVQVLTGSKVTWLASASCLTMFWQDRCGFNQASAELAQAEFPAVEPTGNETAPAGIDLTGNRVFIQFAGMVREDVIALAGKLAAAGWNVEGGDRGGERLGSAAGLMEVRYFHPGDQDRAMLLAQTITDNLPGAPAVATRDVSASKLAGRVPVGHLEVWISK